jgi:hypothetical protein
MSRTTKRALIVGWAVCVVSSMCVIVADGASAAEAPSVYTCQDSGGAYWRVETDTTSWPTAIRASDKAESDRHGNFTGSCDPDAIFRQILDGPPVVTPPVVDGPAVTPPAVEEPAVTPPTVEEPAVTPPPAQDPVTVPVTPPTAEAGLPGRPGEGGSHEDCRTTGSHTCARAQTEPDVVPTGAAQALDVARTGGGVEGAGRHDALAVTGTGTRAMHAALLLIGLGGISRPVPSCSAAEGAGAGSRTCTTDALPGTPCGDGWCVGRRLTTPGSARRHMTAPAPPTCSTGAWCSR